MGWARQILSGLRPPLLTCEAVALETCYLLQRACLDASLPLRLIASGFVVVDFVMQQEIRRLEELMRRYQNVPMSLADACLVRMAELHPGSTVLTLDSDFLIYRQHDREPLSLLIPDRKP